MFTRVLSPINEHDNSTFNSEQQQEPSSSSSTTTACCIHRLLHYGAITLLSISTALLFLQTQAISLRLANQQRQIDSLQSQLQSTSQHMQHEVEQAKDLTVLHMAGTFTLLTCLLTTFHMTTHLRKMNQPAVQRKILAILWMSPIYSLTSFLCLVLPSSAEGYLMILKDFYESYVIYTFLSFLIAVLGRGDREAVVRILRRSADHLDKPYRWLGWMLHPSPEESEEALARAVLMECQVLGMQFFYHAVRDELAWCQPFSKFLTIKGVVFMTFWQGLMINIFFHFSKYTNNSSSSNDDSTISANGIQHILICMEMLFFSIAHWCVFPAEEWQDGYKVQYYEGPGFGFKDFASDVSLIIDDGKKSIRARRERKKSNGSGLDEKDGSVSTSGLSLNGRESPSFGSVDETPDLDSNSSTQPFV
ncbi:hypothetical protein ACHAXN_002996 [Cyclotella atomus]